MRTDKDYAKTKPKITGYLRGITAETTSNRIDLTDSDFVYNTLTIRQSTSESGEFTVGAAIISSCDFVLWNDGGKFDNWDWTNSAAELYLEFSTDKVYLGSYVIISHTTGGNTIKVEALDWLKVFDSHNLGECNITFPVDAVSVVNTIVTTGVQNMLVSGLDSVSSVTLADPADNEMSNRDALAYVAQCLGRFITSRADENTKKTTLRFAWYDVDATYSAGTTFNHQLRTDNISITGVEVTTADGETTESRGDSTGYVVKIMDNPFISADNVAAVADNITASCVGLVFRPGDFAVLSNVRIEAGDTITIDTPKEKGVLTLATDVTYKPAQVKESVIAHTEEAEGDLQITKSAYVKNMIRNELNNPNSDLSSAIGSAAGGSNIKYEIGSFVTSVSGYSLNASPVFGIAFDVDEKGAKCKYSARIGHVSINANEDKTSNSITLQMSGFMDTSNHLGGVFAHPVVAEVEYYDGGIVSKYITADVTYRWIAGQISITAKFYTSDGVQYKPKSGDTIQMQIIAVI